MRAQEGSDAQAKNFCYHLQVFSKFPIYKVDDNITCGLFQNSPQPPKQLFARGAFPDFKDKIVLTVVGSRALSSNSKKILDLLFSQIAGARNLIIVSGLALGADALAHSLALKYNIATIAIPGSGLDERVLYPRSNTALALRILENKGALLSEFAPEQKATSWTFPARNRLMAAIAHKVLVLEAKKRSGTMITARLAIDYNKDLLVVDHGFFDDYASGNKYLIKEGAIPILNKGDLAKELGIEKSAKKEDFNLDDAESLILNLLDSPKSKDELLEMSELSATDFAIALSKLELKGAISEQLGKIFRNF